MRVRWFVEQYNFPIGDKLELIVILMPAVTLATGTRSFPVGTVPVHVHNIVNRHVHVRKLST